MAMASRHSFLWVPFLFIRLSYSERTCCGSNYSSSATEPSCPIDSASSSGGGGSSDDAVSPVFFFLACLSSTAKVERNLCGCLMLCVCRVSFATPQTSIGLGLAGGVAIAALLIFLGVLYARRQRKERGLPSKRDRCGGEDLPFTLLCIGRVIMGEYQPGDNINPSPT